MVNKGTITKNSHMLSQSNTLIQLQSSCYTVICHRPYHFPSRTMEDPLCDLGVLSCLVDCLSILLAWSAFWVGFFLCFGFWFSPRGSDLTSVFPNFHLFMVGLIGAVSSLTVAPIGAGCQFITRAIPCLARIIARQSRHFL